MSKKSSKCLKFLEHKSENTKLAYAQAIKLYEECHHGTIEELVMEALDEQTERVPHHLLKIIDRLESFQDYLLGKGMLGKTVKLQRGRIMTIYKKNRVIIPELEEINPKQTLKREYIEYSDILTKDELRKALPLMRLPSQARVMAMVQGGLSNEECEHLTTRAFLDETYKYHKCSDDLKALEWLADENHPIIWITKLIRVKTGKPYYALLGAEAVNTIASAKLYEYNLKGELPSKLLNVHKNGFNRICSRINDKLDLGVAGQIKHTETTDKDGNIYIRERLFKKFEMLSDIDYEVIKENDTIIIKTNNPNTTIKYYLGGLNRFRPHMLRKFNATYIRGSVLNYEENVRISNSEIDEMQGRGKTSVQDTYIKTNPLEQKLLYAKIMNNVSLYHEYEYKICEDDVCIRVKDPTEENKKLKDENRELKSQLDEKKRNSEKIRALKNEMGEDAFNELVIGIIDAK